MATKARNWGNTCTRRRVRRPIRRPRKRKRLKAKAAMADSITLKPATTKAILYEFHSQVMKGDPAGLSTISR